MKFNMKKLNFLLLLATIPASSLHAANFEEKRLVKYQAPGFDYLIDNPEEKAPQSNWFLNHQKLGKYKTSGFGYLEPI